MNPDYQHLANRLKKFIQYEKQVTEIEEGVVKKRISETDAIAMLTELEKNGSLNWPRLKENDWSELLSVIDMSEKVIKRTTKFQFFLALFEVPVFIIFLLLALHFGWFKDNFTVTISATISFLSAVLMHTYFVLRIHQQSITALDRLSEKRVGILFLRIAANANPENVDAEKLINAGTLMFLGHHVKPADPFSAGDKPGV